MIQSGDVGGGAGGGSGGLAVGATLTLLLPRDEDNARSTAAVAPREPRSQSRACCPVPPGSDGTVGLRTLLRQPRLKCHRGSGGGCWWGAAAATATAAAAAAATAAAALRAPRVHTQHPHIHSFPRCTHLVVGSRGGLWYRGVPLALHSRGPWLRRRRSGGERSNLLVVKQMRCF